MARLPPWMGTALGLLAVVGAVAWGVGLRLRDPATHAAIPAEDPYTHMALVRGHLEDGRLDPLYASGDLYPPGMHAVIAATWVYTGIDLYPIVQFLPVILGGIGLVGLALLGWRLGGPVAGFVACLAFAVAPEAIFRTTMMAPTALDLALIPFLLLSILELVRGRLAWAAPAAVLTACEVLAHPWVFAVLVPAGAIYLVLGALMPWRGARLKPRGTVAAVGILGFGFGLSLTGCAGWCGGGFSDILPQGSLLGLLAPTVLVLAAVAAVLACIPRVWRTRAGRIGKPLIEPRPVTRIVLAVLLAAAAVAIVVPAVLMGLPPYVAPESMFGWPVLALAAAGLVLVPARPTPAALAGAAITLATLPFVVYNPFDSPFWSHRTAVYAGLGVALLAGTAAQVVAAWAGDLAASARTSRTANATGGSARPSPSRIPVATIVPGLLALVVAGGLAQATPPTYDWYRLFPDCEFEALQALAVRIQSEPDLVVVTGDWQSKLVLAGIAGNADRVWYKPDLFTSPASRNATLRDVASGHHRLVVVTDGYLGAGADLSFTNQEPWVPQGSWCPHPRGPGVAAYGALP